MINKKSVNYIDFGAKGDGVADDFAVIVRAHEYANENGLPVVIDDGRDYLIRETMIDGVVKSAVIKTDVVWGSTRFIIDDTDVCYFDGTDRALSPVFKVVSMYDPTDITDPDVLSAIKGIGEGTKRLDYTTGYPFLAVIYNEDEEVYHRYGASYISRGGQCSPKNEILLVSEDGSIDESTPFMFDYSHLTKMTVIRDDVSPLTIKGGVFVTLASRVDSYNTKTGQRAKYIQRNILINRSHVTLDSVEHYVENELSLEDFMEKGIHGAHYWGFYNVAYANDVLLKDCILTGRRSYRFSTYEFHANHVNRIRLEGCTQSNFTLDDGVGNSVYSMSKSPITDWPRCWGIGGSNFCKNMEYRNCRLSRFDAHQGLYNGRIVDSTVNFMEIIGKGELVFENLNWCSPSPGRIYNSFVYLRDDFGCTWDGTITFKNCTFNVSPGDAYVFFYSYTNWDYGYRCHFPNLIMDSPKINGFDPNAELHIVNEAGSVIREPDLHLERTRRVPKNDHMGVDDPNDMTNLNTSSYQ